MEGMWNEVRSGKVRCVRFITLNYTSLEDSRALSLLKASSTYYYFYSY